jgi:hypothetical protein
MSESARRRCAEHEPTLSETHAHAELNFLPHATRQRNPRTIEGHEFSARNLAAALAAIRQTARSRAFATRKLSPSSGYPAKSSGRKPVAEASFAPRPSISLAIRKKIDWPDSVN